MRHPRETSVGRSTSILDALAVRLTDGYVAAAPLLVRALASVTTVDADADDADRVLWMAGSPAAAIIANEVWDYDAGRMLVERQVRVAREAGALVQLQFALNFLANRLVLEGELEAAAALVDEDEHLSHMTGVPPSATPACSWRRSVATKRERRR